MECAPISSAAGGGRLDLAQILSRIFKKSYNTAGGEKRDHVARAGKPALWLLCASRGAPCPREPGLGDLDQTTRPDIQLRNAKATHPTRTGKDTTTGNGRNLQADR